MRVVDHSNQGPRIRPVRVTAGKRCRPAVAPDGRASVPSQARGILCGVDDLDALVGSARDVAESITHEAGDQLLAGADIDRVHECFVVVAVRLLEEVELRAVLAAAGDPDATAQVGKLVSDLRRLDAKLKDEAAAD